MIMLQFQRCTRHLPLRIQQKIPLLPFHLNLPMNRLPVSALIMLRFRKFIYERKTNFTFEYRPPAGKTHSLLMCFSCRPFSIFPIFQFSIFNLFLSAQNFLINFFCLCIIHSTHIILFSICRKMQKFLILRI